jgi:hypothetical protein
MQAGDAPQHWIDKAHARYTVLCMVTRTLCVRRICQWEIACWSLTHLDQ